MKLQASLYSQKQGDKESVAEFLQHKYLLAKRLKIQLTAVELATLMLESLKPPLRRLVRRTNPQTFAEILEAAVKAEQDEADCNFRKPQVAKEEQPSRRPAMESQSAKQPQRLPPCHYCPEHHYH